jgi:hypothetical protein
LSDGAVRFAARYPHVWHIVEADGAGPWLMRTGLFPAAELHRVAGLSSDGTNREDFQPIDLGDARKAILRPQLMQDHRLMPVLAGGYAGRPDLWRRLVDQHVFFWAEERRRDAFMRACMRLRAAPVRPPVTLTIDTAALLARHGAIAFYATFNIGSAVRGGARVPRDESTLRPVADYRSGPVAELAIRGRTGLSGITICEA